MLVTKINVPEMELLEINLPLNIIVPISRQHVPSGNSASPEKLTRSLVNCDHAAAAGAAAGLSSGPVSKSKNEALPLEAVTSTRFFSRPPRVNFTRQRPARFADCPEVLADWGEGAGKATA